MCVAKKYSNLLWITLLKNYISAAHEIMAGWSESKGKKRTYLQRYAILSVFCYGKINEYIVIQQVFSSLSSLCCKDSYGCGGNLIAETILVVAAAAAASAEVAVPFDLCLRER